MRNGITRKGWLYFQNILKEKWLVSSGLTKNISDRNDELLCYLLPPPAFATHTSPMQAHVRTRTCAHVCTHACTTCSHTCAHVCAPACAHRFMCACAHACSCLHSPVPVHVHACARMFTHAFTCAHPEISPRHAVKSPAASAGACGWEEAISWREGNRLLGIRFLPITIFIQRDERRVFAREIRANGMAGWLLF